jgi:acetyl esterase/lipase
VHDPLRDEGNALARRLRDLGVEAQHLPHGGLVHGFRGLSHVSEAAAEPAAISLTVVKTSSAAVQLRCPPYGPRWTIDERYRRTVPRGRLAG